MRLNSIKPAEGSKQDAKRVGRGIGSGLGKTGGRVDPFTVLIVLPVNGRICRPAFPGCGLHSQAARTDRSLFTVGVFLFRVERH